MSNDACFALELSEQGEHALQAQLKDMPFDEWAMLIMALKSVEVYRHHGAVLRVWDYEDCSESSPLMRFLKALMESLPLEDYRYVFESPHGDITSAGCYEGPHHLREVQCPLMEYDPQGTHIPAPSLSPGANPMEPRVLFPVLHTALVQAADAEDKDALQNQLEKFSKSIRMTDAEIFRHQDEILAYASRPDNRGKALRFRLMVHIQAETLD